MEADRFETLLRAVATRTSRRGLAGILGGLALGGVLALEAGDEAEAAPRRRRRRRKKRASDPFTPSPIAPRCGRLNETCTSFLSCCNWGVPYQNSYYCPIRVDGEPLDPPCPYVTCASVNAQKGAKTCATGTQCCKPEATSCTDDCDCCGSLLCEQGLCTTCRQVGAVCSESSECCPGIFCSDGHCQGG